MFRNFELPVSVFGSDLCLYSKTIIDRLLSLEYING